MVKSACMYASSQQRNTTNYVSFGLYGMSTAAPCMILLHLNNPSETENGLVVAGCGYVRRQTIFSISWWTY